jgi:hypothetical protein
VHSVISVRRTFLPSDLAANHLLVQHEQATHPLYMDGQPGLRLCWLRRLKLGFGKLLASSLTASPLAAAAESAASVGSASACLLRLLELHRLHALLSRWFWVFRLPS